MSSKTIVIGMAAVIASVFACETERTSSESVPTYVEQIETALTTQCVHCHAGIAPPGGWAADSYLSAIGCTATGVPAASRGPTPPIVGALDRPDHAGFASPQTRAVLASWAANGAPRSKRGVHASSFADPRSPESHGRFLRARRWAPMLDANDADACGTCHDGSPTRREGITLPAPGAPACTTCHAEPTGTLGCSTCHGSAREPANVRAYPPRDRCFFPEDPAERAHAAHAGASASRATGLPCSTCHPAPQEGPTQMQGTHGDGHVEVWFDYAVAGRDARFDAANKSCAGTCHARGGARPSPAWSDAPMTCNDCHGSPPPGHYSGACTSCHREANATGTALTMPVLHANGKVDLGDGSGRCGACHGQGDDPWPSTGAHRAHAQPEQSKPVACETCHEVPSGGAQHPLGKGAATVRLGGLATRGGRRATFDPATKSCAGTYCHEGSGGAQQAPRWTDGAAARTCGSCHASPPPPPHVQVASTTCGGASCHEGSTTGAGMTPAGRAAHVDGLITRGLP